MEAKVLTPKEDDLALKYSENPEALKTLLSEITVAVESRGKRRYSPEDKEEREVLEVTIERGSRKIRFEYGCSIHDTEALYAKKFNPYERNILRGKNYNKPFEYQLAIKKVCKEYEDGLLYSLLCCCRSEYYCPKDFEEFCAEYGYNTDSRKAEELHRACLSQSAKLERIFKADEIEYLPS